MNAETPAPQKLALVFKAFHAVPMSDEQTPEDQLAHFYDRNGYARLPKPERRTNEGSQRYKKGWEVRLVARDDEELALLYRLLKRTGFEPGRSFGKARQTVLPLYGRQKVQRFLQMVGKEKALEEYTKSVEALDVPEKANRSTGVSRSQLNEKTAGKKKAKTKGQKISEKNRLQPDT